MSTNATYRQLRDLGWSEGEAKSRAAVIDGSHAYGKSMASGLSDGDLVVVEYDGSGAGRWGTGEGVVINGRLTVGGCQPSAGMIGRVLTRPYRLVGGDWVKTGEPRAVLADGTPVIDLGSKYGDPAQYSAAGKTYPTVIAAALDLTPAVA